MGKNLVPWVLAGFLALGCLALLDRSCAGPDPAYWVERAKYDAENKAAAELHAADLAVIAADKETIAKKDAEISAIMTNASKPTPAEQAKDRTIAELQAKVERLEASGDLAGALATAKTEISAWAEKFSLAERRHQDSLSALNNAWQVKFDAQVDISVHWEAAYNREHGLRLTCDSLRLGLEKKLYGGKFWKWLALGEPVVFGIISVLGGKR